MSELLLTSLPSSSIAIPAAGQASVFVDSLTKTLRLKDDTGYVQGQRLDNFSIAAQVVPAASRTYLTGSRIIIPSTKLQIGTILRWRFNLTKTAAGIAASTFDICFGTAGTTADTARVSFAKPAGTAAIDEAWCEIHAVVRGPLSAAGIVAGTFQMVHNGNTVGHAIIPVVVVTTISAGFDITAANLSAGICLTSGAADAVTLQLMTAEAINL